MRKPVWILLNNLMISSISSANSSFLINTHQFYEAFIIINKVSYSFGIGFLNLEVRALKMENSSFIYDNSNYDKSRKIIARSLIECSVYLQLFSIKNCNFKGGYVVPVGSVNFN